MIYLLDYGLIRPTTNTSFTVCFILTLKSSNPVYSVQFINTFCVQHFNFKKFQSCLLSSVYKYFLSFLNFKWCQSSMVMGTSIFYWDTISRWFPTKAEDQFTCQWDGDNTFSCIKLIFQRFSGVLSIVMDTNSVIETPCLGDWQVAGKNDLSSHYMKTLPCQASKWYQ